MRGKDIKRLRSLKRQKCRDSLESKTRTGSRTHRGFKIHPPPRSHKQTTQTEQTDGLLIWGRRKKKVELEFRDSNGVQADWCHGRAGVSLRVKEQCGNGNFKQSAYTWFGICPCWEIHPRSLVGQELKRGLPITVLTRLCLIFRFEQGVSHGDRNSQLG